ncbi:MAG: hypothetical protein SFZ03_04830 [Candidatus Melainabacteria bacterium]|nr:hypothetical protein [Candidatus Melainabacteria bacterium]
MATVLELINEVLRRTGQSEVETLSNAETPVIQALDFLNDTYAEMLQTLSANRLERSASFNTVNGTASYSLASNADLNGLLADSVQETASQTLLTEVDSTWPLTHGTAATGRPVVFYRSNNQVVLYPTPNAVYTIGYRYLVKPSKLTTGNQTTEIPAEWERVLVRGTQAQLEKFLGENGYETTLLLFREGIQLLRSRARLKPISRMRGPYQGYHHP